MGGIPSRPTEMRVEAQNQPEYLKGSSINEIATSNRVTLGFVRLSQNKGQNKSFACHGPGIESVSTGPRKPLKIWDQG